MLRDQKQSKNTDEQRKVKKTGKRRAKTPQLQSSKVEKNAVKERKCFLQPK